MWCVRRRYGVGASSYGVGGAGGAARRGRGARAAAGAGRRGVGARAAPRRRARRAHHAPSATAPPPPPHTAHHHARLAEPPLTALSPPKDTLSLQPRSHSKDQLPDQPPCDMDCF
ncbi:unnamed protein product [Chrysodeixis includens]|uniref:Uncharacterized protein n=1 Tax=Chrysodeixis includens TaxID=689277 RepID=A0A9N8L185_CHRIL|nr:unnamed protein product [Chrysodeixis includens]